MYEMVKECYIDEIMNYEDEAVEVSDEDEDEEEEPSKDEIIAKLQEENEKLKSCLKGYWSDGEIGDWDAWKIPDEWESELDELSKYEDDEVDYYIDAGRKVVLKDGTIKNTKD
jgi:hypothetical protein